VQSLNINRRDTYYRFAEFESVSQIGQTASMDERAKIREYVEEIVAEMLGGNLDHIRVGQLSKSENCKYDSINANAIHVIGANPN